MIRALAAFVLGASAGLVGLLYGLGRAYRIGFDEAEAQRQGVDVPARLYLATRDVAKRAATPRARSSAAGDELAVSFDSDDRAAMAHVAALFLARVAYLDERAAEREATHA